MHAKGVHYGSAKRFAAPELVSSWSGVVDATRRGLACPQVPSRLDDVTGLVVAGLDFSEDCLVLSVTAPPDAEGLPVMVWFHGGAYMSGSGESLKYAPDALVTEGHVVVVNVSYRLGIFGYRTPEQLDTTRTKPTMSRAIGSHVPTIDNMVAFFDRVSATDETSEFAVCRFTIDSGITGSSRPSTRTVT
nr:carboxylesterase family protein [Nocardia vinacea]